MDRQDFYKRIRKTKGKLVKLRNHATTKDTAWVEPLNDVIQILDRTFSATEKVGATQKS
jgi:hypothetical protein